MIIYKITNKINGKVYIGQTRVSLKTRWAQHCRPKSNSRALRHAIEKYGVDSFLIEEVLRVSNQTELDAQECHHIQQFNSLVPGGYNLTSGGEGGYTRSEETRKKLSEAGRGKGRPHTPESRAKLSAAKMGNKNPQFGKKQSPETIAKRSQALKGRKRASEVIAAIRAHHNPKSNLNLTHNRKAA